MLESKTKTKQKMHMPGDIPPEQSDPLGIYYRNHYHLGRHWKKENELLQTATRKVNQKDFSLSSYVDNL